MKVFIILESFTDYSGGNASSFGVYATKEKAIEALPKVVIERCNYASVEEWEEYNGPFDEYFDNEEHTQWSWDRDDDLIEFYIQEDEYYD